MAAKPPVPRKTGKPGRSSTRMRRGKLVDLFVSDQVYAYARLTDRQSVVTIINNAVDRATRDCWSLRSLRAAVNLH